MARPLRPHRRVRADLLPPPAQEHGAQGGQHRRLGDPLRRCLSAVPDPRCRQRHARRYAAGAGRGDGGASGHRPDPDPAGHHRRHDAVRPHAAIRRPALWPGDRPRHRLVARHRGQLLGPQRADPHRGLRRTGRPARTARPQAVRRPYPQPRFRRGRADPPRRLGHPHDARRWKAATRKARPP